MIDCKLFFNTKKNRFRTHAYQAISGFIALEKQKKISLTLDLKSDIYIPQINTFCCEINNRKVYYDTDDGTANLLPGVIDHLRQEKSVLFKRAYDARAYEHDDLIRPYGLNYMKRFNTLFEKACFLLARNSFLSPTVLRLQLSNIDDWSFKGCHIDNTNRILFCTRLWDPKDSELPVDALNEKRISIITALRKAFRNNIIVGVKDSPISRKLCRDLILSPKITKRGNYLGLIGKSSVCVTTAGLYQSNGWKLGEYVAHGKAIVTEPLHYSVPGHFCEGQNYLSFSSVEELIDKCDYLLSAPEKRREMENNNNDYFLQYLRPDVLIWNTIKQVVDCP